MLRYSHVFHRRALLVAQTQLPAAATRCYSIDTPPEDLRTNVPALSDNIDMKNISLQVTGGRSSVSGIRATVFGASGRLGHHIVNALGRIGSQVVIPYRNDGTEVHDMKLMGDLGQIVPLPYQIRDKRSVERVIEGSNVVINCIQRRRESRNFSFHDTHVNATHMIARTAAELGVDRFIQVSHANVSPDSPSEFYRTKWHGEQVAKSFYPEATIIRPGICYGYGDYFFERMGYQWSLIWKKPKLVNGKQIIQPCHFLDVSRAVSAAILDPINTKGKTYNIYGPVRGTKSMFFERSQEVNMLMRCYVKCYRDWNPKLLGAFYKPIYPIQKKIQFLFDFFRWHHNCEFLSYEDIALNMVDVYPNYDDDPDMLTLEDLGLKPEDYFYWEAKLNEPFYDRFTPAMEDIEMRRTQTTWGGQVPTTEFYSFHSLSSQGYRQIKRGGMNWDWWQFDSPDPNWQQPADKELPVHYGSDVDGNNSLENHSYGT